MEPESRESPGIYWAKAACALFAVVFVLIFFNAALIVDIFNGRVASDGVIASSLQLSSPSRNAHGGRTSSAIPPSSTSVSSMGTGGNDHFSDADVERLWDQLNVNGTYPWSALEELWTMRREERISKTLFETARDRMFSARPSADLAERSATRDCKLLLEPFPDGRRLTGVVLTVITGGPDRSKYMLSMVEHSWDALTRFLLVPQGLDFTFVLDSSTHSGTEEHVAELARQMHLPLEEAEISREEGPRVLGVHVNSYEIVTRRWRYQPDTSGWESPFGPDGHSPPSVNVVIRTQPLGFPSSALNLHHIREKEGISPPQYEVTRAINPDYCQPDDAVAYIQGTRWYTYDMFVTPEAQQYDYLFKLDYDIFFYDYMPFNIMVDMNRRNAMFMHTVSFDRGECTCSNNLAQMNTEFSQRWGDLASDGAGCSQSPKALSPCDLYYTNFVGFRAEYFRSPQALAFGRWMNDFGHEDAGFFRNRWSDQPHPHKAMGYFIGPDFNAHVADYSQFRCSKEHECWATIEDELCISRHTTFIHSKGYGQFDRLFDTFPRTAAPKIEPIADSKSSPYPLSGQWVCKKR